MKFYKKRKKNISDLAAFRRVSRRLTRNVSLAPALETTLCQLEKDLNAALSFWRHVRKEVRIKPSHNRLQIGGGTHILKNFVNLDMFPPADIVWDCRYGLPFKSSEFKFIFSEHFLEHIAFPGAVNAVLKEIRRVLKPGGTLFLGVPDGGAAIKAYVQNDRKFLDHLKKNYLKRKPGVELHGDLDLVNYVFRDQLENPRYTAHYWAYDKDSLTRLLKWAGFKKVGVAGFNPRYCNPKRKDYTLYVKATK